MLGDRSADRFWDGNASGEFVVASRRRWERKTRVIVLINAITKNALELRVLSCQISEFSVRSDKEFYV
jgi:hypothetical protein